MAIDPFSLAEERFRELQEDRRSRRLQARAFRAAVRELAVSDAEGRTWMLGPEDGTWYRRDPQRWVAAEPPRRLICPHCGHHNLSRHSFCVDCGGRLRRPR